MVSAHRPKSLHFIFAFCCFLFFCQAVHSQPLTAKEQTLRDAYKLQLSLEETSGLVNKNFWAKERVILLQEKIVLLSCMPQVYKTLTYSLSNISDNCKSEIDKLQKLDPNSAVGACARFGINSQPCRDAYTKIYVDFTRNQPSAGETNESIGKDYYVSQIKPPEDRGGLLRAVEKTTKAYRENSDPEASFNLYVLASNAFFDYLPDSCDSVHNRVL